MTDDVNPLKSKDNAPSDAGERAIAGRCLRAQGKTGYGSSDGTASEFGNNQTHYLFSVSKTSLILQFNRFKRCSSVLSVTFCSPISIRCNEDVETPNFREKAGRLNEPRFFRRNRPKRNCNDAAMPGVCRDQIPTCGNYFLPPFAKINTLPVQECHRHLAGRNCDAAFRRINAKLRRVAWDGLC